MLCFFCCPSIGSSCAAAGWCALVASAILCLSLPPERDFAVHHLANLLLADVLQLKFSSREGTEGMDMSWIVECQEEELLKTISENAKLKWQFVAK